MKRTPTADNGKVLQLRPPRRQPNRATRTSEHLTPAEVEKFITAAGKGRGTDRGTFAATVRRVADGASR
jgi:hypothetical protein